VLILNRLRIVGNYGSRENVDRSTQSEKHYAEQNLFPLMNAARTSTFEKA
jgi:hypothetical protein